MIKTTYDDVMICEWRMENLNTGMDEWNKEIWWKIF